MRSPARGHHHHTHRSDRRRAADIPTPAPTRNDSRTPLLEHFHNRLCDRGLYGIGQISRTNLPLPRELPRSTLRNRGRFLVRGRDPKLECIGRTHRPALRNCYQPKATTHDRIAYESRGSII